MAGTFAIGSDTLVMDGEIRLSEGDFRLAPLPDGGKMVALRAGGGGDGAPTVVAPHAASHYSTDPLALDSIPGVLNASKLHGGAVLNTLSLGAADPVPGASEPLYILNPTAGEHYVVSRMGWKKAAADTEAYAEQVFFCERAAPSTVQDWLFSNGVAMADGQTLASRRWYVFDWVGVNYSASVDAQGRWFFGIHADLTTAIAAQITLPAATADTGGIAFGETKLYREAANRLRTGGSFAAASFRLAGTEIVSAAGVMAGVSVPWSLLTSVPTSLSGYGITDAASDAELAAHAATTTSVHGIADTSTLVLTSDARLSDARPPTAHVHAAGDITSGTVALARGGTNTDNSSQAANLIFASPSSGGAGAMSLRSLVAADIPTLDASKIGTGALALARGGTGVDGSSQAINLVFASPASGSAGALALRALAAADIPALDAGKITTGALAQARQNAQTAYLDAAAGQTFANRADFTGGVTIGAVSGTIGRIVSASGNTNGFSVMGRNGTTYCFTILNEAGAPFLRVANNTTAVDLPGALSVGTNITLVSPTTATTATAGAQTLPANPVGFLVVSMGGTSRKIAYYAT